MHHHTFQSNVISKCSYDKETKELHLYFHSGGGYKYDGVPQDVYDDLLAAESAGKFFHKNINRLYPSEKL